MYELKENGKVFTSKFVGTGPSSYEKRIYRAAVSQRLKNTGLGTDTTQQNQHLSGYTSPDMCGFFNPTCLSGLLPTKWLQFLNLLIVGDVQLAWRTRLMTTGKNFCWCLKYTNRRRRWMHRLWESRTVGEYFKLCKILNFLIRSENITRWT